MIEYWHYIKAMKENPTKDSDRDEPSPTESGFRDEIDRVTLWS